MLGDMSFYVPESSVVTALDDGGNGFNSVHLVVMGLSGVGKSTFISMATGDTSILIGAGIEGGMYSIAATLQCNSR
jgi:ABC-type lipoprotein export system ATPase subunit